MPLLSPNNFNVGNTTAREIVLNSDGNVADWGTVTESWIGVRAVINLKSDTQISGGIGTANDPYTIKEVA